jgi:LuxR family maltose regulon positive regulatory protein
MQKFTIHNAEIHTIDASAFFFDREGTANLFRMEGLRLSDDELESVFMTTEGWVSAIRLQMLNYSENGSFDFTADIGFSAVGFHHRQLYTPAGGDYDGAANAA